MSEKYRLINDIENFGKSGDTVEIVNASESPHWDYWIRNAQGEEIEATKFDIEPISDSEYLDFHPEI